MDGDWAKPIEAIDKAEKGDVIVVDVNGGKTAIWGELATWSAKLKGLAGVVIDGAVRDVDDIVKMDFPVFCRYISPNAGEPKGFGEIGAEINCGNQVVQTGDWIIGDDSGVVVVPQEIAQEIANRALDVKEQENRIREEIKAGESLGTVVKVKKWEKKIG
jgi:3-hexulose-6-phosphate synthase/6-phospho-3-hexuloisomerase